MSENNQNYKLSRAAKGRVIADLASATAQLSYWNSTAKNGQSPQSLRKVFYLTVETENKSVEVTNPRSPQRHFQGLVDILHEIQKTGIITSSLRNRLKQRGAPSYLLHIPEQGSQPDDKLKTKAIESNVDQIALEALATDAEQTETSETTPRKK